MARCITTRRIGERQQYPLPVGFAVVYTPREQRGRRSRKATEFQTFWISRSVFGNSRKSSLSGYHQRTRDAGLTNFRMFLVVFVRSLGPAGKFPPREGDRSQVGNRVLIGSNATLMPVDICDGAIIGAGAVVTRDVKEPGKSNIVSGLSFVIRLRYQVVQRVRTRLQDRQERTRKCPHEVQ